MEGLAPLSKATYPQQNKQTTNTADTARCSPSGDEHDRDGDEIKT